MITNIAFRKLTNGWTVKYHVKTDAGPPEPERGYSQEAYVADTSTLAQFVQDLIEKHMP